MIMLRIRKWMSEKSAKCEEINKIDTRMEVGEVVK